MNDAAPIPDAEGLVAALGGRSIVLIGMMGAGKTSVGRRLGERLNLPFVDAVRVVALVVLSLSYLVALAPAAFGGLAPGLASGAAP